MAPKKRSYSYWKENFERLEEFKKKHGHCRVPQKFADDRKLGTWVTQQRSQKKNISAEKRKLRDGIGFDWAPLDAKWNEMYERLAAYKKEHGVCHVPENVDKTLRQWICNQRTYQRNGALLPDREAKLNHIEFRWANEQTDQRAVQLRHDRWQANYDKLVEFKQEHGHCLVPHNCKDHSSLGRFVSCQRMFKLGLTSKQIGLLDEIGFQWTCNKRSSRSVENNQEDACDDEVSLNDEGTIVSHAKSVDAKRSDTERASNALGLGQASGCTDSEAGGATILSPALDTPKTITPRSSNDRPNLGASGLSKEATSRKSTDEASHDQTSTNDESIDLEYIPRVVHLREVADVKRKYKTKARRYFDERNELRDEVKRLKVELHRAHLPVGAQLLPPRNGSRGNQESGVYV